MARNYQGTRSLHGTLFPPESNWWPPSEYPELRNSTVLAIDVETCDPNLQRLGPGGIRGDGYVVGICIATNTGFKGYFPMRHQGGGNLSAQSTIAWLKEQLHDYNGYIVGANIIYDMEWLHTEGIDISNKKLCDIQIMEGLIDEEGEYNLDYLSKKYLGFGKDEDLLRAAAAEYGICAKKELWKLHSKYVGPYGEADAYNTLLIYEKQLGHIASGNLWEVFKLEHDVLPIVFKMRINGVRVDIPAAKALSDKLAAEEQVLSRQIASMIGFAPNVWANSTLVAAAKYAGVQCGYTARGNESFTKEWLEHQEAPIFGLIKNCREINRLKGTFIGQKIIDVAINGRIHAQFKQMPSDEGGTRTGRFSSANPNLQQVPSRSALAKHVRALFIPEHGELWAKLDYSQQEPRLAVHFALACKFSGAQEIKQAYEQGVDFYSFMVEKAGVTRTQSKTLTLGRMYGMGIRAMAERLGCSIEDAEQILAAFDEQAPFLKKLFQACDNRAQDIGVIRTLGHRARHFNKFIPVGARDYVPATYELAKLKWPGEPLQRADTRKAFNSLIQGSAADMTKSAMVKIYNKFGLVPLSQVHDELNYSVKSTEEAHEINKICESAVDLLVPIKCELQLGNHWK